jgi:hypothetical protein
MRNPFTRLALRDTARPSLRDRAAALKASASRVIRRKPVDAGAAMPDVTPSALLAADPILAAIAETRRLMVARVRAGDLPQPAGSIDPLPEQEAAAGAFNTHVDDVLLKTVPTTAAGCVALARYAVDFLGEEGFALDEDQANEQHVRILDLIARSPMLGGEHAGRPFVPDMAELSDDALIRTYDAFSHACDIGGLTTWTLHDEAGGSRILEAEMDRLWTFQADIADELARRGTPGNSSMAARRVDTLIHRAVACGDYEEAARLASEADAKRL